jgi:6-phosphogluconolactonase
MKPRIISSPYPQPWTKNAVEFIIHAAEDAVSQRGRFSIALSGGHTPKPVYQALAEPENSSRIDWNRTAVFWGDERCVPPDDEQSNYRMAKQTLLDHVPIPADNTFRMEGELPPTEAASRYRQRLETYFSGHIPALDLAILGLGPDGHTASLFPGSEGLSEEEQPVIANYAPSQQAWRITLTYPVLLAARQVMLLVVGEEKAGVLAEILQQPEEASYPAARIVREHPAVTWMLDSEAAKNL